MAFRRIYPGHDGILRHPRPVPSSLHASVGEDGPARIGRLAHNAPCYIVARSNRSLEKQCASRPSRSSSNANHLGNQGPTLRNRRSGEGLTLTSHRVSKISRMETSLIRITRPPPVVPTALEHQASAFTSASGCKECRKLAARCA